MPETIHSERLGIVGLGLVGTALAERLLAAGFFVAGFDMDHGRIEHLRGLGGCGADSAGQVAGKCRRVLLSLPTSAVVRSVLDEIEPCLEPGSVVVDTTTGEPEEIVGFGKRLLNQGVAYLDATIGGSSRQIRAKEAIVICGGEANAFARCEDLFSTCFGKTFYVGPCGSGARMKLVLNLVLGLNRAVLAEGLAYARACGIDPAEALEILKAGPAYSRAMDTKGQKMLDGDFAPEARLSQHLKDVRLILASGERYGAKLPFSALHRQLLERLEDQGYGAADNSAVIRAFQGDK